MNRHVVLMLKEPRPGRVKTRLGRDIGMVEAAWWFRHQTAQLIRRLDDPRWQLILAVAPDHAGLISRVWPRHLPRLAQGRGNLGKRMRHVFTSLPPGPSLIVGGDIPGVTPGHIVRAFDCLGESDAVAGPAPDGGYWMIGLRHPTRMPAGFMQDVRWSTEHALADTLASLGRHSVALTDTLQDVDTVDDLRSLALTR